MHTRIDSARCASAWRLLVGAWFLASLMCPWLATSTAAQLVEGEPPVGKDIVTFVVLPDTQNYSQHHPEQYEAQTEWIVAQKERRNIACVLHLGDITNNNVRPEWEVAQRAMSTLDGHVPYVMAPGNHDYGPGGNAATRETEFNEFFPLARYSSLATYGGVYDKEPQRLDNSYHLIEAADRKWLILALEFGPRKDVVRWANEVVAAHPDRSAILVTHAYVYNDSTRYDWRTKGAAQKWNPYSYGVANIEGGVADGEDLWRGLVSRHPQFVLVVNGHVLGDGLGYLESSGAGGQPVAQMLVNFQMKPKGGDGWLRLLEIQADRRTIKVYDYSPTLDQTNTSADNQFTFVLPDPTR